MGTYEIKSQETVLVEFIRILCLSLFAAPIFIIPVNMNISVNFEYLSA